MLFQKRFWPLIADGSVTVTFRRWRQRQAVAGGRYRTPSGFIDVTSIGVVDPSEVTDRDAVQAGYASAAELLAGLPDKPEVPLYRIDFRFAGTDDPRADLAADDAITDEDLDLIERRLARFDTASKSGPWTDMTLGLIEARPGTRAPDLAALVGRETQDFKRDVRKLKEMGLTIILKVGY